MSVVERVALAILNSDRNAAGFPATGSRTTIPDSDGYVRNARAAIEALMEHTLVYRDAGHVVHEMRGAPDDIWKTLLRAALEDGE